MCHNGIQYQSQDIICVKQVQLPVQEIAFTIANAIEYIQTCIDRGLKD